MTYLLTLDFAPLSLAVTNGTLQLNQAPAGQAKLDWTTDESANGVPFTLGVAATVSLVVSGDASIEFADLLTVEGSCMLTQFDLGATAYSGLLGAGATGLALELSASGATAGRACSTG